MEQWVLTQLQANSLVIDHYKNSAILAQEEIQKLRKDIAEMKKEQEVAATSTTDILEDGTD